MPKATSVPKGLRPFVFHGVEFDHDGTKDNAAADCPFCGKEGKLSVHVESSEWKCWVCGERGNAVGFLRLLWDRSVEATNGESKVLAKARSLLWSDTLLRWGVCKSIISGDWLVPGWNPEGKLCQLYRWQKDWKTGKNVLRATWELPHQLFMPDGKLPDKGTVYVCEGPWDGMVWWESLRSLKRADTTELAPTGSESASLLADACVIAVPGSSTFSEAWAKLLARRYGILLYDSDHAKEVNGKTVEGAGWAGMRRAANVLANAEEPPELIHCVHWGEGGFDPDLPSGTDLRDVLGKGDTLAARAPLVASVLERILPIPEGWVVGRTKAAAKGGGTEIEPLPCSDWKTLVGSWRKAMKWTEGLDRALSVMLASAASTDSAGDQLWIKVLGPPACGKSTLCEALSVSKRYVVAKSTIRGFHSGFKASGDETEDNSLLAMVKGKTLVTKDGDTLLQAPNLGQILAEARDVYDRVSRTHYRNKASKDYDGVSMTWLLCGTSSLRGIDSSELGERFLDCVIADDIDEELEREVGWRVVNRAWRDMAISSSAEDAADRESADYMEAKRLTGGYLEWLRTNAQDLFRRVEPTEAALQTCQHLAEFVAFMRARPSLKQEEKAEREMSFRLAIQLTRLMACLCIVLNRSTPDAEVIRRVRAVALDTARGRTLDLVKLLYKEGDEGMSSQALAIGTGHGEEKEKTYLRFLRQIKALSYFRKKNKDGTLSQNMRWKLTPRMRTLFEQAYAWTGRR